MLKKIVLLVGAIYMAQLSLAQDVPYLPPVVLPSPNAASLGTYGDHPVSTYTGIPDISIPIFDVDEKGNSLPISLSYHAGGVRAGDAGSSVGMNWSLQAGGAITRSIKGLNDFSVGSGAGFGYLSSNPNQHIPRYNFSNEPLYFEHDDPVNRANISNSRMSGILEEMIRFGTYDTQPDDFYFNFNGFSGQFTYDRHRQIHIVKKSGSENFEIEELTGDDGHPEPNFKIKAGNGDVYYFEAREVTRSEKDRLVPVSDPREIRITLAVTSWYLTKVEFRNGGVVNLQYTTPSSTTTFKDKHISYSYGRYLDCLGTNANTYHNLNTSYSDVYQIFLKEISYSKGNVKFDYNGRQLDQIEIKDHQNELVNKFLFGYDNSNRRWLTSITELGSTTHSKPPYTFSYYQKELLPSREDSRYKTDHWGYYNGIGGLVPRNFSEYPYVDPINYHASWMANLSYNDRYLDVANGNREPDAEKMKYGILSKIEYPTGGYTTFEYEANEYSNFDPYWDTDEDQVTNHYVGEVCAYTNHNGGNFSCNNGVQSSLSEWLSPDILEINLNIGPFQSNYDHVKLIVERGNGYNDIDTIAILTRENNRMNRIPTSSGFFRITAVAANTGPVSGYINATVTSKRYERNFIEKKIGPGLRIKRITTNDGGAADNNIVRTYNYSNPQKLEKSSGIIMSKPEYAYIDYSYRPNGTSLGETYLNLCQTLTVGNSSLKPLNTSASGGYIGYSYVTENFGETGQFGKKTYSYINIQDELVNEHGDPNYNPNIYLYATSGSSPIQVPVIPGFARENYAYKNGTLINSKTYEYDQQTTTFKLKQEQKYTYSFSKIPLSESYVFSGSWKGQSKVAEMMKWARIKVKRFTKRMFSEQLISYEEDQSQTTSTYYHYTTDNGTKLDRITQYWDDGNWQNTWFTYPTNFSTQVVGSSIDKGSNNNYVKLGGYYAVYADGKLSKIYEYERQGFDDHDYMPDGEPANSEFFKVSAEYAYNNNDRLIQETRRDGISKSYLWGYGGEYPTAEVVGAETTNIFYTSFEDNGIADGQAKTGDKVKTGSFQFPTTFSPSTSDLLMSYWYWQNGKWQFSGEIPYHPSIGPFTKLDEVRVYPRGALMTTYTYKPIVGLTSLTDPNNLTSYFHYDNLNRLIMVKDNDGKILQTTQYNYAK